MTTNADITVFNKRYVKEERTEKFVATRIKGVSLFSRTGAGFGSQNLSQSDAHTIRIPADADTDGKQYIDQKAYVELGDEESAGFWTLQIGAIIVPCLEDVDTATETELKQQYPDVITVRNYTDNRSRGSDRMKHWRVGGE